MTRVCLYTHISTDEENQPTSLASQHERLEAFCKVQEDWRIVARHDDRSTGTKLDRPGLQAALGLARQGRIDQLLVYRIDRLSRKVRQLAQLAEELDACGVVLRSATEPFDSCASSSPSCASTARPTSSPPTASSHPTAPTQPGFAQRPKKWRRRESNPRNVPAVRRTDDEASPVHGNRRLRWQRLAFSRIQRFRPPILRAVWRHSRGGRAHEDRATSARNPARQSRSAPAQARCSSRPRPAVYPPGQGTARQPG